MQAENQTERELTDMLTAKELLGRAQALEPQLVEWRRTLHRHPEVGFDLTQTKALVKKALTEMGYEPKDCGKAGVIALAGGKKPGKTILLRGDMDALPIQEESGVDYASEVPGKMHGCGHDMHTAMMLGAAQLLKEHEDEIEGTVKLEFQPAEEIFQGSPDMIANGLLENPNVDAAVMFHVLGGMPIPAGVVLVPACGGIPIFSAILRISSFFSPFIACIMLFILPMSGIALLSPFFCLALMASMALLGMPIFSAIFHIASSFKPMYCLLFFFVLTHSQHMLG